MIRLLDFVITKLEKHTKNNNKLELYRKILCLIDSYKYDNYGYTTLRYYRYKVLTADDISRWED